MSADDAWLDRYMGQAREANALTDDILAELRAKGLLRRMRNGPYKPTDENLNYIPGFDEDWTNE